ncbi:MAG: RecQ family ATP-dependent DNA helicase, partial [Flavobacterium sp.]|nr:RecQ family ATP-dependent DNA helicase [Flavobacterium sp.]
RAHFPKVPFIALTASATEKVRQDIIINSGLQKPVIFQKSFARPNLAYMVYQVEDKLYLTLQILKKNPQPAIIYVRNRKSCVQISAQLKASGIKSVYYHGGLPPKEKELAMQQWMSESAQVIVATNAFGMGIDKPNVRSVIHLQLPENLENYYQEAGRCGRDGNKAFAVMLTSASDAQVAENQFISVLPDTAYLKKIFVRLCNYFQVAYGEGIDERYSFNLNLFCLQYGFPVMKTFNALQFLDSQGVLTLSQEFSRSTTVQFIVPSKEVIRYTSLNPADAEIILIILRSYPGIYEMSTALNLPMIAKKAGAAEDEVTQLLLKLQQLQLIDYHANDHDSSIIFNEIREDERTINRVAKYLEQQNKLKTVRLQSVLQFARDSVTCKSKLILGYFGEVQKSDCGICSVCIVKNKSNVTMADLAESILQILAEGNYSSRDLCDKTSAGSEEVVKVLQLLLERGDVIITSNNIFKLKNGKS